MATLAACATGNLTTAGTWALVDATSLNNTETASIAVTTSYQTSATFTPGAITIDGIAIKFNTRNGTTGTITVALDLATVDVTGTVVTVNMSDIDNVAGVEGGWYFFKFAAPVLLVVATAYGVKVKTSSSSQATLYGNVTTDWARFLRTTTTQAPVAGDNMIIAGEFTAAGAMTARTVTMDETATTDYGATSTNLVLPAIAICKGGTIKLGVAASTAYNLKVSGHIITYSGGTRNFLQAADAFPTTSSFTLLMDCVSSVDFIITDRNGSTVYEDSNETKIVKTLMTADKAAAATVIAVASTSGWVVGDELAFASTTQTASQSEKKTILTVDSSTQVTLTAGLTNAHSGTSPTQAEVINLTRRIKITSTSLTVCTAWDVKATAVVTSRDIERVFHGSATANKRGIDVATTTGTFNVQRCSVHDCTSTSSIGCNISSASGSNITFSSNVVYNMGQAFVNVATTGVQTVNSNCSILTTASNPTFSFADAGGVYTNNIVAGSTNRGFTISEQATLGTVSGNTAHSGASIGFQAQNVCGGTLLNISVWRNASIGFDTNGSPIGAIVIDGLTAFGNSGSNIFGNAAGGAEVNTVFKNLNSNGDTTFATTNGLSRLAATSSAIQFINCNFSQASGILTAHTNEITISSSTAAPPHLWLTFENCKFGAANFFAVGTQVNMSDDSFVRLLSKNQTAGSDFFYTNISTQTPDTVIYSTAPQSLRILPIAATRRAQSAGICPPMVMGTFVAAVNSGGTLTVSVKVRESASGDAGGSTYNGSRCRLIVLENRAMGITADTVLATATSASAGAFETISGTTAAVSRDGFLEFVVDCGFTGWTTGWVNVADWTAA